MYPITKLKEIEQFEEKVENMEIVVLLFVKPRSDPEILNEFEYIHYCSGKYCSIYAVGYTNDPHKLNDTTYRKVDVSMESDWYFSTKAFNDFKEDLQDRIHWQYSGESELLILQNNPSGRSPLNFQNYVAIDINKGIKEGYIDSFQRFMESLIRSAKSEVTAKDAIDQVRKSKLSVKGAITAAIQDCQKIPTPVKTIICDRLFYRTANYFTHS